VLRLTLTFLVAVLAWPSLQAQSPSHRPSENFRPPSQREVVVLPGAQDGELTLEEYHRRRIIHEGQREQAQNRPSPQGLDREIEQAFKALMDPGVLLGIKGVQKPQRDDSSALEREARISAELDRQIERAREERERWNNESSTVIAQAYSDEDYENDLRELQKVQQQQLNRAQDNQDLSPQQMRELLRSLQGPQTGEPIPPEFVDTMAEDLFRAFTPIREMSSAEFKKLVVKALEGKPVLSKIKEDHLAVEILTDLVQDPKAIPNLGLIVEDRPKLLKFFIANILLLIMSLIWKRKQKKVINWFSCSF
jgi:hypothetical protein